jgi:hypothetical protein
MKSIYLTFNVGLTELVGLRESTTMARTSLIIIRKNFYDKQLTSELSKLQPTNEIASAKSM